MAMGAVGKVAGIPMDLLGVSWFGNFAAMAGLGVGSIVIGMIKTNGFGFALFGHQITFASNIFGSNFDSSSLPFTYLGHGLMIGAGMVALIQCAQMLMAKNDDNSSAVSQLHLQHEGYAGRHGQGLFWPMPWWLWGWPWCAASSAR